MFEDREDAGRKLAVEIEKTLKGKDFIVVALARGGVVLGKIIADYFNVPLGVLVIKKVGAPSNPELAIGAAGLKGALYLDKSLIRKLGVDRKYIVNLSQKKFQEAEALEKELMGNKKLPNFKNKKVIVVDDGVATGATAICASKFLKNEESKFIILATPVIAKDVFIDIKEYYDNVITLHAAEDFSAVGQFYSYFPQIKNEEVKEILSEASD